MAVDIFSGLSALSALTGTARGLKDMNDAVVRNAASLELQEKILAAREAYSALLDKVDDLEAKLAAYERWDAERLRYELKKQGDSNVLAYSLKEGAEPTEPQHSICPDCYQQRKKSLLQTQERYLQAGQQIALTCQVCGWKGYLWGGPS